MSDEDSVSDSEPTASDLQFDEYGAGEPKSRNESITLHPASKSLTNQDIAIMLDIHRPETDQTRSRNYRAAAPGSQRQTRSGELPLCTLRGSLSNPPRDPTCTENASPSPVRASNAPLTRRSIPTRTEHVDEYSDSESCAPFGSTPNTSSDENTPKRRLVTNLAVRGGNVDSPSSTFGNYDVQLAGSTPTTSRCRYYGSGDHEVVNADNYENDEITHSSAGQNLQSSSRALQDLETESPVCKALQEITGIINSVAKRIDTIEGKLSEKAISGTARKKHKKRKFL